MPAAAWVQKLQKKLKQKVPEPVVIRENPNPKLPEAQAPKRSVDRWACGVCTYDNSFDSRFCEQCESERPKEIALPALNLPVQNEDWCDGWDEEYQLLNDEEKAAVIFREPPPRRPALPRGVEDEQKADNDGYARNNIVIAAFEDSVFQLSLKHYPEDPLTVRVFAGLGYHCVPQLGVYSENYNPTPPVMLLELPERHLRVQLPPALMALLAPRVEHRNVEFYFMVHEPFVADIPLPPHQQGRLNAMFHMWAFNNARFDPNVEIADRLEVGLFDPINVQALPGAGDQRIAVLHNNRFSPNNCQFQLTPDTPFSTFFLASIFNGRSVVSFHIVLSAAVRDAMHAAVANSLTLRDWVDCLQQDPTFHPILPQVTRILRPFGIAN